MAIDVDSAGAGGAVVSAGAGLAAGAGSAAVVAAGAGAVVSSLLEGLLEQAARARAQAAANSGKWVFMADSIGGMRKDD